MRGQVASQAAPDTMRHPPSSRGLVCGRGAPQRRRVIAERECAFLSLGAIAAAETGNEGVGESGILDLERQCLAALPGAGLREKPPARRLAAILAADERPTPSVD